MVPAWSRAVSLHITSIIIRNGGRLPLLSTRPLVTFPATQRRHQFASLSCLYDLSTVQVNPLKQLPRTLLVISHIISSVWYTKGHSMNAEWLEVGLWPQSVQQPKVSQSHSSSVHLGFGFCRPLYSTHIYLLIYLCCIIKLHNKKLRLQNWLHQLTCKWHSQGILTKNYLTELWSSAKFSGQ